MYNLTIQIKNKRGNVHKTIARQMPQSWNELTRKQLLRILAAMLSIRNPDKFKLAIVQILLDIPSTLLILIDPAQVWLIFKKAKFIQAEDKKLTTQLLPWVKVPGLLSRRYYGPRENFRNLLFLEFVFADTFFIAYCTKQDEATLNKFIACLYRHKAAFHFIKKHLTSYTGDIRQPFNEHLIDARAQVLARLPMEEKYAILTWYRGCRNYLERWFPHVFSEGNQAAAKKSNWGDVLRSMSGGLQNIKATGQVLILNVLAEMEDRAIQVEEAERKNSYAQ